MGPGQKGFSMKKNFRKLLVAALILAAVLPAAGCSEEKAPVQAPSDATEAVQVRPDSGKCTELGTPLADLRVRQALVHAIDMDTVVEALFHGNARKATAFGLPGMEGHQIEYSPEKAKELLAAAGWPTEYVLDVVYYYDDQLTADVLNVIADYWEAVGVRSSIRKLEGDVAAQLWTAPGDPGSDDSAVEWDLAYGAVAALTESEFYTRFASHASNNSHTPPQEGLDGWIESGDYEQVRELLAQQVLVIPLYHQNCFVFTGSHLDLAGNDVGNDQFAYEKGILNWTTDREDQTLYTNGGPVDFYWDPLVNPGQYLYQELVFERLINADAGLNPTEGLLAESYRLSDDGLTLEFTLREELFWHDGEPLTAEDVKFTFELYLRSPGASSVLTAVLDKLEGAQAFKDGDAEDCTGIRVEENRIIFSFEKASEDVLTVFSQWPVLPKHCLEDVQPEKLQQDRFWKAPIGSGPYRVAETVLGEYCVLERWEEYRLTGTGNIQRIHMAASGETDKDLVLRANLGQLDYAWGKSADDAHSLEKLEDMTVTPVEIPYLRCFYINQFPHGSYHQQDEPTE